MKYVGKEHNGIFGSGRFCSLKCSRSYSATKNNITRKQKISKTLKKNLDKFCKCCGCKIDSRPGHNKYGYCSKCKPKFIKYPQSAKEKQSIAMKGRNRWHIHRNQISYAENFWIEVLNNNKINFVKEKQIQKDESYHCYYLDFEIGKIDLEIDGSQHKQLERYENDLKRDEFLRKQGYFVYRIAWNEINSEEGKQMMKDKIELFLDFYDFFLKNDAI